MAATKTFETQFRINAVWAGQKGVQQAQRQMSGLARTVQTAGVRVKGMARSVFAGVAAQQALSRAVSGTIEIVQKSIAAASEAQEAHDELGLSIERNAKRYKSLSGKSAAEVTAAVEESTQALIKASEEMEKTGHDAETLQKGFARLAATGALDPKQILEQRDAFSDILSYTAGANATMEESAQLGDLWADAILRGNLALLKQMDLSSGEIALFRDVEKQIKKGDITAEEGIKRRQKLIITFTKKFKDETERVFERPSGKIAQMWTQVGNVLETIGQPFIDKAPELADSFKKIALEVKPVADELAKITAQGLKDFAKWLDEGGADTVVKNLRHIVDGIKGLETALNTVNDALTKHRSLWEWLQTVGEPAKRPQLPGAPSQEPIPGGAGTQGEAARRANEGRARLESSAKAIEEAEKAGAKAAAEPLGTGWSTRASKAAEEAAKAAPMPAAPAFTTPPTAPTAPGPTVEKAIEGAQTATPVDKNLVAQVLREAENRKIPAPIRNRNPGAQYPGESARKFGTIGTQSLMGGKHKIAQFPTATHGAAANFENLANSKHYIGKTIHDAMVTWSGGYRTMPGPAGKYDPDTVITRAMVNDPAFAVPFMQAIASGEAPGGEKVLSESQWQQAYQWYKAGGPQTGKPTASLRSQTRGLGGSQVAGGTTLNMNSPITVNGVQPGRESLMASKTALAIRDPVAEGLAQLRKWQRADQRLAYNA